MSGPRILYITGQLGRGGAEQQFYYLLRTLQPEAKVLSLRAGGYWAGPIRELGYEVIELERQGRADLGRLWRSDQIMREYDPDIVHLVLDNAYALYGRIPALLQRRRVIVGERNHPTRAPRWYDLLRSRLLNRFAARIVPNSEAAREYLLAQGISSDKVQVIPNGIDLASIRSQASNGAPPLPQEWRDCFVIGAVGKLNPVKAPEIFIEAAAIAHRQRPDLRFVFLGEGPLQDELQVRIEALGMQDIVLLPGHRQDVPCWLANFDLFTLTSREEGLPNAIMEAMVLGLPVVATDAGGCRELVREGETGHIVPIDDVQAVAQRWLMLAGDAELRGRMGARAQAIIAEYSLESMAQRYREVYEKAMR